MAGAGPGMWGGTQRNPGAALGRVGFADLAGPRSQFRTWLLPAQPWAVGTLWGPVRTAPLQLPPTPARLAHPLPSHGTGAPIWLRRPHLTLWEAPGGGCRGPVAALPTVLCVPGPHSPSLAALPGCAQHWVKRPSGIGQTFPASASSHVAPGGLPCGAGNETGA